MGQQSRHIGEIHDQLQRVGLTQPAHLSFEGWGVAAPGSVACPGPRRLANITHLLSNLIRYLLRHRTRGATCTPSPECSLPVCGPVSYTHLTLPTKRIV